MQATTAGLISHLTNSIMCAHVSPICEPFLC